MHPRYVGVIGPGDEATAQQCARAKEAGKRLSERGYIVVTGGLSGVMAAAASGAESAGGTALALLPGLDRRSASPGHSVVVPTGLGEMRNALLVRTADAVIAIGGSWGTLSEIALAVRTGVPVFAVESWDLHRPGIDTCSTIAEAVEKVGRAAYGTGKPPPTG